MFESLKKEHHEVLHIAPHDSRTHMWSAATMLLYLDFLADQIRAKRLSLGLSASEGRCLVICDKASQHHSPDYAAARERWERSNNCILAHGQSKQHGITIPGGWGAAGGPNDGWHQHWHALRRSLQKVKADLGGSLALRKALAELDMAVDGGARFSHLARQIEPIER